MNELTPKELENIFSRDMDDYWDVGDEPGCGCETAKEDASKLVAHVKFQSARIAELGAALESILKIEQDDALGWLNASLQIKRICRAVLGGVNETDR